MRTFIQAAPGDIFDPQKAEADANRLMARGDFATVSYELTTEEDRTVLIYIAKEKDWGPDYVLFDGNLSTDFKGNTAWGLRLDYDKRWLNSLGGELRTDFQLGRPNALLVELYQPLDLHQTFFVAPSAFARQDIQYLYDGDTIVSQLDTRRYGGELDGGVAFGSWGEYRVGLLRGSADGRINVASPFIPDLGRMELGALTTRFVYDTQDLRLFPTTGSHGTLSGYFSRTALGGAANYETASFNWSTTFTGWRRRNVWTLLLSAGSDFNSHAPYYDQFSKGGLFNFSGYQVNQLVGREYALGALQFRRAVSYLAETFGTAVYVGASVEAGNVYERLDRTPSSGVLLGGSLFLGIHSALGPVYLAYGQSEGGRRAVYLYLGSSLDAYGQFR
jgi:NTE family protein